MKNATRKRPPAVAKYLLKKILPEFDAGFLIGDFEETYKDVFSEKGRFRANLWFWAQILKSVPNLIKSKYDWGKGMALNFMKIAFRNLVKQRFYSTINIFGLAAGMACSLLILLFIKVETSYDTFHKNAKHIYRVVQNASFPNDISYSAVTPSLMAEVLQRDFPQVRSFARVYKERPDPAIKHDDKLFVQSDFYYADPQFFEIFDFEFVSGNARTALDDPHSIVITEEIATKYFGGQDPLGQTLVYVDSERFSLQQHLEPDKAGKGPDNVNFIVTGVIKDVPQNSHFQFGMIVSLEYLMKVSWRKGYYQRTTASAWHSGDFHTYLLLDSEEDRDILEKELPAFTEKYIQEKAREYGYTIELELQPLLDIHLRSKRTGEFTATSDIRYIYIFSILALFVSIIAITNFINLSTAKYQPRSKEVGMRKVFGANRKQLAMQFLGESVFFSIIAFAVSMLLAQLFMPVFNNLTGLDIVIFSFQHIRVMALFFGLTVLAGLFSGIYPALFFSNFNIIRLFKNKMYRSAANFALRKSLVTLQFVITVVLIICTLLIKEQIDFIQNKDLGFMKEKIIDISLPDQSSKRGAQLIKSEIEKIGGVLSATATTVYPGNGRNLATNDITLLEAGGSKTVYPVNVQQIDENFLNTFQIELMQGEDFKPELTNGFMINETAAERMGKSNILGKQLQYFSFSGPVIGIFKDFHVASLHEKINPMVLMLHKEIAFHLFVRVADENGDVIRQLENVWKRMVPNRPFLYSYLDTNLEQVYSFESKINRAVTGFSVIAILISCLGLLGLTAFNIEQKTKEIGVRKVLGAKVSRILILLNKDFIILLFSSCVFSWPIAYYVMDKWLQGYAFRTEIGAYVFIYATGIAFGISLLAVCFQALKAAYANPIDTLRYE